MNIQCEGLTVLEKVQQKTEKKTSDIVSAFERLKLVTEVEKVELIQEVKFKNDQV